jgi:hypothetical protein
VSVSHGVSEDAVRRDQILDTSHLDDVRRLPVGRHGVPGHAG